MDKATVDALLGDAWHGVEVDARLMATLEFLDALTLRPSSVDEAMVARTIAAGVSPGALEHATLRCFVFSYMNRMVDAFGADVTPEQAEVLAATLDGVHGRIERLRPAKPWQRFAGRVPDDLRNQLELVRKGEGDSPAELRAAIEAHVAQACGVTRTGSTELPEEVAAIVEVLATDAHGVTDAHIRDLEAAEWSEEAIYEMIWVASFAAGLGRTERAITLLAKH